MGTIRMEYEYNNDRLRIVNNVRKNKKSIISEFNYEIAHEQVIKAKLICKSAVDVWYSEYDPKAYSRKYSLYDAFDIGIKNGDTFVFEVGDDLMALHHLSNDIVYNTTFIKGFHGGPIWRTPIPLYTYELGPAVLSISPYEMIVRDWEEYINGEFLLKRMDILFNVMKKYI